MINNHIRIIVMESEWILRNLSQFKSSTGSVEYHPKMRCWDCWEWQRLRLRWPSCSRSWHCGFPQWPLLARQGHSGSGSRALGQPKFDDLARSNRNPKVPTGLRNLHLSSFFGNCSLISFIFLSCTLNYSWSLDTPGLSARGFVQDFEDHAEQENVQAAGLLHGILADSAAFTGAYKICWWTTMLKAREI